MTTPTSFLDAIKAAITRYAPDTAVEAGTSIEKLEAILKDKGIPNSKFFSAATIASSTRLGQRPVRNAISYKVNTRTAAQLAYSLNSAQQFTLDPAVVKTCVASTNEVIELIYDLTLLYDVNFFEILGMRNLSSFVGELFARELHKAYDKVLIKNPNQDGYPDLCALTNEGKAYICKNLDRNGKPLPNKELWSPYPFGGVEVKATCGNTPAAAVQAKPLIGESRLPILLSAEWKAHHQQTQILLGLFWDFVDGIPTILAAFFRNDLETTVGKDNKDWAPTVRPKDGGSRTTSVSIMRHGKSQDHGVKKMGQGWLVLPIDTGLLTPITRVFGI